MPHAEPASILDASALIAFLHDEPGSDQILEAIARTAAVSVVNWAETLSKVASDGNDPEQVAGSNPSPSAFVRAGLGGRAGVGRRRPR